MTRMIKTIKGVFINKHRIAMIRRNPQGILEITMNSLSNPNVYNHPDQLWFSISEETFQELIKWTK